MRKARVASVCVLLLFFGSTTFCASIPAPKEVLGFEVGEDRKLADWGQVLDYLQKVAAADPLRVKFTELGKSTLGKPFVLLTISAPENLKNLDRYREIQARLADPRGLSDQEANRLVGEGKAIVLITCTVHSTEVASSQTALEFVYRLLTEDTPRHRTILKETVFLLVPSLNPDGQDMVVQWYRKTLGTRYEGSHPPFLYHHYVGHDDNRDWYMFTQVETRLTIEKAHNVWHPHVVYDMHQMRSNSARIFTPPWLDPVEPNIDPLLVSEVNMLGTAMAADLATAGKKGVVVNAMYDYWTPARHYQSYHGGLRVLTESASARLASPIQVRFEQLDTNALGYNAQQASWNYPDPWPGGTWRLRDIMDYQLIAMESCLFHAAQNREMFLRNFYRIGKNALAPRTQGPVAFLVPPDQKDPSTAAKMLNVLRFGMVEVHRASKPFSADGLEYPAGTYVVPLEQPYGPWAKTMLERQRYPDLRLYPGGPPKRPYDVTAHTLPLLMGVKTVEVRARFQAETERVTGDIPPPPGVTMGGPSGRYRLKSESNNAFLAVNRLLKTGGKVWRDRNGDFLVSEEGFAPGRFHPFVQNLGLHFIREESPISKDARTLRAPRIGLYKSYVPSMDEGWTRYVLDQFEFPYTSIFDKDIREGKLNERFDVILIADMSPRVIVNGQPREAPTPPTRQARAPVSTDAGRRERGEESGFQGPVPEEFTGGLGEAGVGSLREFVTRGGTLVLLNRASLFGIERLGVGARDVLAEVATRDFYAPGSLLRVRLDPAHPVAHGMDAEAAVWFEHGPAFEPTFQSSVSGAVTPVASFPDGNPLMSGWLLGDHLIQKRHVILDARLGRGHAVLFGIRPQYRAQSHGTYKLLFNALFYF